MFCEFRPQSTVCYVVSDCAKNSEIRSKQVEEMDLQNPFVPPVHVCEITDIYAVEPVLGN